MKTGFVLLFPLLIAGFCAAGSPVTTAQERPAPHKPGDIAMDANWSILPREDVYEVGASKLDLSTIRDLDRVGFRKLTRPEAEFYTGQYYQCPAGKAPYLVSAVYQPGVVGRFHAERKAASLDIIFGGLAGMLGNDLRGCEKTAVVVNLDFTPDQTYCECSIGY